MEDTMFEDLEQSQGGFQDSSPHSSVGSEAAASRPLSGFGTQAHVTGGGASRQGQASPLPSGATRHSQPQVQLSAQLGRAYSEPASNLFAPDNRYSSGPTASGATADNWFSRSVAQQQQRLGGGIQEEQQTVSGDQLGFDGSGMQLHRLLSDMGPGVQTPQQWTPTAGAHNAALAMLLSDSGNGRRHSTSSLPESQSNHPLNPLLAGLSHEQQQLLVNAGLDPSLLMSVKAPVPAPTANPQLDTAEAVWQHVAASGADDQTLLALAAGLGLITTDSNSGAVILTREMSQRVGSRGVHSPPAPVSARGSMFGGGPQPASSPSQSAPLPRLSQPNLAGLLALQASFNNGTLRLPTGSPGLKNVCGSPGPSKQHTLYKTELCRGWIETGTCRYGSKCQFAHGRDELRPVPRHPKYKTEVCRSFTATGVCAYGPRCRFIHGVASAPCNALFDGSGYSARMGDSGTEGVLGFDDMSSFSPGATAADAAGGGPRKQLLSAVSGSSAALRQAAGSNSAAASHDAASMAKIAARLLANGGRGSLDSSMSMATVARASWSEVNRASLDSRTGGNNGGGRMSLESCMSQGDVMMAREMMMMGGASSNERLNAHSSERLSTGDSNAMSYSSPSHHQGLTTDALMSLSASLAAGGGGGMHQPFMPGIPEGCAMTLSSLPADPWAGIPTAGSQAAQQQMRMSGGGGGDAYNMPFNFLLPRANSGQEPGDNSTFMMGNLPAIQQGPAAGTWWDPATSAAAGKQRPVAEHLVASSLHMSAYQSGLYAPVTSSNQQQQPAGVGKQQGFGPSPRGSYPGMLTPEQSETSVEPASDNNLRV